MLAAMFFMEHDRARLAGKAEPVLEAGDLILVLFAGQARLRRIGIDRQAVEIVPAPGERVGLRFPFGERAVQIARDGPAHLGERDALVFLGVQQMRVEVLAETALAGEGDHDPRPIALSSAARMTASSPVARSMSVAFSGAVSSASRISSRRERRAAAA